MLSESDRYRFRPAPGHRLLVGLGGIERFLRSLGRYAAGSRDISWREAAGRARRLRSKRTERRPAAGPEGRPILLLPAVPWAYRLQRPQQLARALVELSHPVLYVDGFGRHLVQPLRQLVHDPTGVDVLKVRIPGRPDLYRTTAGPHGAEVCARVVEEGLAIRPDFIVAQLPGWRPIALRLQRAFQVPLVYDCVDLQTAFPDVPALVAVAEEELARSATLVTCSSRVLCERMAGWNHHVVHLPNAARPEDFARKQVESPCSRDCPLTVGYVGALGDWFDDEAVRRAASKRERWQFRLAGRVESNEVRALADLPNIHLEGEIDYARVPHFLSTLDVALIPFDDTALTRAVDPVKLYEALAAGLPVVARDLPGLDGWNQPYVYRYRDPSEFMEQITRAVGENSDSRIQARRARSHVESWSGRAATLVSWVRRIQEEPSRIGVDWEVARRGVESPSWR